MTKYSSPAFKPLTMAALISIVLFAASPVIARDNSVNIGTIEEARRITLQSSGAAGGLAGAAIGYNLGSGNSDSRRRRRAIIGGAVGSRAASSTTPGMEYSVRFLDGTTTTLVSDQVHLEIGQCVSVEIVGGSANIREQDPTACNPDPEVQEAVADLQDEMMDLAAKCAEAKRRLLDAETMEAVEIATAQARILCN